MKTNLHTHTTFCDGTCSAEEMVLAALERGFDVLGFSGHSYTAFDEEPCMSLANTASYKAEIARLKSVYSSKIKIFAGIEQDYYSVESTEDYDYVIGSVHYIKLGEKYVCIDHTMEKLQEGIDFFGGDVYALCEKYFELAADVTSRTGCDIIGHFDLISKLNGSGALFDESHPRYVAAWKNAADALLKTGVLFEINTGGIYRGYRESAYPLPCMVEYIAKHGGRFILSSDSHDRESLGFSFGDFEKYRSTILDLPDCLAQR